MACNGMHPFERSLVQKYQGRPLVVLGVNGDDDRAHAKSFAQRKGMDWPILWGPQGKILTKFQGKSYPTLILIDSQGVVRCVHEQSGRYQQLEGLIEAVVQEAERK